MSEVIITHEKQGVLVYANALAVVKRRAELGYFYDDPEDYEWILESHDEHAADSFLHQRSDYEYEDYEYRTVIE